MRGRQSTVGNLIEIRWLSKTYHGPQLTGICVEQKRGTISSNSRSQAVPSPPTKSLGFEGLDSSKLLILKGGNSYARRIL